MEDGGGKGGRSRRRGRLIWRDERWSWRRGGGMAEHDGGDGGTAVQWRPEAAAAAAAAACGRWRRDDSGEEL